jgi:hypothetical protein
VACAATTMALAIVRSKLAMTDVGADVRGLEVLGAQRPLEMSLSGFATVQDARHSNLQPLRHLALNAPRPVSVSDQTHQRPHHCYPQVLPLTSRERLILCYVLELSALLGALALPREE